MDIYILQCCDCDQTYYWPEEEEAERCPTCYLKVHPEDAIRSDVPPQRKTILEYPPDPVDNAVTFTAFQTCVFCGKEGPLSRGNTNCEAWDNSKTNAFTDGWSDASTNLMCCRDCVDQIPKVRNGY